jgi:GH25 family lysozyme M1 (1,4-beta-N-acetylmuramidase)
MKPFYAIDVSLWSYKGGAIPVEKWEEVKAAGYEMAIVGLWTGAYINESAVGSLENARAAGLRIAAYYIHHDGNTPEFHLQKAKEAAGYLFNELEFLAIDIEVKPVTLETILRAVELVKEENLIPVIYTAGWFWNQYMYGVTELSDTPLWTADYDGDEDINKIHKYGGWEYCFGKQYIGDSKDLFSEMQVDASIFRGSPNDSPTEG